MNQIYFDYQDNSQSQSMAKAKSNNNNNAPISDKANNSISYLHGNNRIIAQFNDVSKQDYYGDEDDDGNNNMMNSIIPIAPKIPIAPTAVAINSNGAIRQGVMKAKRADVSTGRWTVDEQKTFVKGIEMYGKEWKKIALMIPTRTVVQIRTHAQKYFIKLARKEAIANNNPLLFNPKVSISSNPLKSSSVANVNPLPIQSSKPAMHETLSPSVSSDSDSSASSSSMKRIINNNKMQIKRNRLSYAKIPTDEVISPKIESKCIKHLDYNGNNKHQRSDGVMSDELDLSRQLLAKRQRKAQISSTSFISIANDNDKSLVHNTGLATPVSMGGERLSIINGNSFSPRNDHSGFFQKRKNKVLLPVCYEDESNEDDNQQQQQTQLHNTDSSPCGISDLFYIFPNDASHGGGYPLLPKNETNELLNMMALDGFDGDGDDNLGIITPLKQKKSSISTSRDIHGDDDDASSVGSLDDQNNNTNNRKGSFLANGDSTYSSLVAEEVLDDSVFDMTHMSSNGASNDLLISEELNVVCPSGNRKMVVMMDNNNQKEYSSSAIPQTPPRQKISVTKEMYSPVPVSLFHMPPVIGEAELNNIFDEWQSSDVTMASASY